MQKVIYLCFAVAVLAAGNGGVVQQAQARWKPEYADSPYAKWFAQQRNKAGQLCCDSADAHAIYNAYIRQGKWHVSIGGRDYEIQPYQLLKGPNPTGHALIWYLNDTVRSRIFIYCFSPGTLF